MGVLNFKFMKQANCLATSAMGEVAKRVGINAT